MDKDDSRYIFSSFYLCLCLQAFACEFVLFLISIIAKCHIFVTEVVVVSIGTFLVVAVCRFILIPAEIKLEGDSYQINPCSGFCLTTLNPQHHSRFGQLFLVAVCLFVCLSPQFSIDLIIVVLFDDYYRF